MTTSAAPGRRLGPDVEAARHDPNPRRRTVDRRSAPGPAHRVVARPAASRIAPTTAPSAIMRRHRATPSCDAIERRHRATPSLSPRRSPHRGRRSILTTARARRPECAGRTSAADPPRPRPGCVLTAVCHSWEVSSVVVSCQTGARCVGGWSCAVRERPRRRGVAWVGRKDQPSRAVIKSVTGSGPFDDRRPIREIFGPRPAAWVSGGALC